MYVKVGIITVFFDFNNGLMIEEQNLFFSNPLFILDANARKSL